jgi:hypothetical protein
MGPLPSDAPGPGPPVVVIRRAGCRIATAFFAAPATPPPADLLRLRSVHERPAGRVSSFFTLLVDLHRSPEALRAAIKPRTREAIRQAETRDGLTYRVSPGSGRALGEFLAFYDRFAASKGLPGAERDLLAGLAAAGALDLSAVARGSNVLVWHAHCRHPERAMLLASASFFRSVDDSAARSRIGRANRLHHWLDLLRFRHDGLAIYDFGGWYEGQADPDRLRINRFKEEFGGTVAQHFDAEIPLTLRGRLAQRLRDWLRRRPPAGAASGTARTGPSCTAAPCS